jgi:hypothetical protein
MRNGVVPPWRSGFASAILLPMAQRHGERLRPAQERLLVPARDGEVEVGERAAVLDLDSVAADMPRLALLPRKISLECSSCGYGIVRSAPPERCPMCQAVDAWAHTPWRPLSSTRALGRVPSMRTL